jgi:hypothetical protein
MAYSLKTVSEINYIEFSYLASELFNVMKGNCAMVVSALVAQGAIKDPDPFLLTDDNLEFFKTSCQSAIGSAYSLMAQLSRHMVNIIPMTVFDMDNDSIKLNVGNKSTINEASLIVWDNAIKDYLISYVLKDWYTMFMPNGQAGIIEASTALNRITQQRSISQ